MAAVTVRSENSTATTGTDRAASGAAGAFADLNERFWAILSERLAAGVETDAVGRDVEFLARLQPFMETFAAWFAPEVRGMDRIPTSGPMLLVGNHSGGMFTPDTTCFLTTWFRERGLDDPLVGLAFDLAYLAPPIGEFFRRIGQIPANNANAAAALRAGASVFVYPGGDREVYRPWSERARVDFGGRQGYVRLALREQVPVVPVVGWGGHDTLIVVSRGEQLAKRLGFGRVNTKIMPLALTFPSGLVPGMAMPYLPLPAKVTMQVLDPVAWPELGPDAADDPAIVARCAAEIEARMQDALDALVAERPWPLVTRALDAADAAVERVAAGVAANPVTALGVGVGGAAAEAAVRRVRGVADGLSRRLRRPARRA